MSETAGEVGVAQGSDRHERSGDLEGGHADEVLSTDLHHLRLMLRKKMELLAGHAEVLYANYTSFVLNEENKNNYDWRNRSILHLYIAKDWNEEGGLNNFQIKWNTIVFYGTKGNRKPYKKSVKKLAKGDNYSFSELKESAKEWEWPYVEEIEKKFGWIRRQASFVAKANENLRYAIMANDKYNDIFSGGAL